MKVKEESEKVGLKLNIQKTKIMASGSTTSWQIDGETTETMRDYFFELVKTMVFPIVMYECESWTVKKAECQRIDAFELCVVLEKTLESPLENKEIQRVYPKGNQS